MKFYGILSVQRPDSSGETMNVDGMDVVAKHLCCRPSSDALFPDIADLIGEIDETYVVRGAADHRYPEDVKLAELAGGAPFMAVRGHTWPLVRIAEASDRRVAAEQALRNGILSSSAWGVVLEKTSQELVRTRVDYVVLTDRPVDPALKLHVIEE